MYLRKAIAAGFALCGLTFSTSFAGLSTEDYIEAAWMTTRFYGAQRSGEGPNWILDGTQHPTSFTKDSYQGKDISGGWFDCGDHVMFGQSQGWAAYVLALGFAEFTTGFYDLYTGDYTDYKSSKDYSRKGGKSNDIRDLLEELRYEANFWVKAAPDENTFIVVKGNADKDHNKWVTAGMMSTLGNGDGGEPRDITANTNDAFTPGMVGAMMAVMARIDPDESNRTKYLKAAKNAYAYSSKHSGVTTSGTYYLSDWWNGIWEDAPFLAALELYRTTKDESYKTEAKKWFDKIDVTKASMTRFGYSNATPLSMILGSKIFGWEPVGYLAGPEVYLDDMYGSKVENDIFMKETGGAGSFSVRTPSGAAFLYALYAKLYKDKNYDDIIEKNIAYLLGDNGSKKSYVVGFDKNGANAPKNPHHRGYYGNEDPGRDVNGAPQPPEKNKLLGGMIAGDFTSGSHNGSTADWQTNEVCVDLNAPLVGALGYILSKRAPIEKVASDRPELAADTVKKDTVVKDTAKKDTVVKDTLNKDTIAKDTTKKDTVPKISIPAIALAEQGIAVVRNGSLITVTNKNNAQFKVDVFDMNGKFLQTIRSTSSSISFTPKAKGALVIKVTSKSFAQTFKVNSL